MALTLIAPLASGVNGAGSGTAEFYARGTTTRINVYSDPDGAAVIGNSATLDSNGGVEAYADEPVFVRVRSSLGVVVREFTVVVADNAIDCESASFTGLLPSGSQGAGGVVDEKTLLDRWYASAGTTDFKVLRQGQTAPQTLVSALASVSSSNQPLFNVVTYGADSTGVIAADAAFKAAHDAAVAAGGGVILVPGGTFTLGSAFSITSQKVSMMGFGAKATLIQSGVASGVAITVNAGASTYSGSFIQDLTIAAFSSGANVAPIQVVSTPGLLLRNVCISGFALAADFQSRVILHGCDFTVPSSATAGDYVAKFSSNAADSLIVGGTYKQSRATNTGALSLGVNNIAVVGSVVDISAITPGAGYGVDVGAANCKVESSDLITGASATYAMRVNGDFSFHENDNTFAGSGRLHYLSTSLNKLTRVVLGSRNNRCATQNVSITGTTFVTLDPSYKFHYVVITAAASTPHIQVIFSPVNSVHTGHELVVFFENQSLQVVTFDPSAYNAGVNYGNVGTGSVTITSASGIIRSFSYVFLGPTSFAVVTEAMVTGTAITS